nr:hypothetical protein [Mycoplasmopsis bovis]
MCTASTSLISVHYVIDETNWRWNIDQVKSQTNKNSLTALLRLKEILERLIAGYDMKTVSNILVGLKFKESIYNLFGQNYNWNKACGYAKYQKKCKLCVVIVT